MAGERVFPPEKMAKLDSPERQARQPARLLVDLLAGYRPKRVLEIGVGTGYFALPIAARLAGANLLADLGLYSGPARPENKSFVDLAATVAEGKVSGTNGPFITINASAIFGGVNRTAGLGVADRTTIPVSPGTPAQRLIRPADSAVVA